MHVKHNFIPFLIVIALLSSCSQPPANDNGIDRYTLEEKGILNLELDSLSGDSPSNLYVYQQNGTEYLVKGNFSNWRLDIYNLTSQKLYKTIPFEKEGPNGVGNSPTGFYFHNLDSIFLFFNLSQRICLVNDSGVLLNNIGPLNTINRYTYPDISAERYPFLKDNELHLSTYGHKYKENQQSGMIINLVTELGKQPHKLTDIYSKGYWGGVLYDVYYHDYNRKEDLIIQSYGADHQIYTIDDMGTKKAHMAKGERLNEKIRPYSDLDQDFMSVAQHLYKFEALQGGYGQIRYDPYRDVYYRFVFNPVNPSEFHSPSQIWENPSIIILNKKFSKIGEFPLPKANKFFFMFISKAGLNIFNTKQFEKTEEKLPFTTFELVKDEH